MECLNFWFVLFNLFNSNLSTGSTRRNFKKEVTMQERNVKVGMKRIRDLWWPVWPDLANFATLVAFKTNLAILKSFIYYLAKLWTYISKIFCYWTNSHCYNLDKYWKKFSHLVTLVVAQHLVHKHWRSQSKYLTLGLGDLGPIPCTNFAEVVYAQCDQNKIAKCL